MTPRSERFRPSAKAVVVDDGRLLVTRNRTPGDPGPDWHIFPGGGSRPGETLEAAVVREVREETGIEVRPRGLLWVREVIVASRTRAIPQNPTEHALEFMFAADFVADHQDPTEEDQYQVGVEWVGPDELASRRFYPAAVVPSLLSYLNGGPSGEVYLGDVD